MPFIAVAVVLIGGVLAVIALMPLSLVLRYRAGTARRPARSFVAAINLVAVGISAAVLLIVAAFMSHSIAMAFRHALMGLSGGCLLGVLGLWLSRWEVTPRSVYYTPNRALVLTITLVVMVRLIYGFWRSWHHVRADHRFPRPFASVGPSPAPVLTGMAIGAGSLLPPAFLPRQASLAFAAILIAFIAGIYFGFAVVNGSGRDQLVEFSVASLFAVAALLGLLYWPLLLPIAHLAMPAGIWRTTTAPACPWSPSRAGTCRGAG